MNIRKNLIVLSCALLSIQLFSMNEENLSNNEKKFSKDNGDEVVRFEINGNEITLSVKKGTSKVFLVKKEQVSSKAPIQQTEFSPKPQINTEQLKNQTYPKQPISQK